MEKYVCENCIGDYSLQELINQESVKTACDYCDLVSDDGPIAAPISELMPRIWDGIEREWADPDDEGIVWDNEDGRYMVDVYDSHDLLRRLIYTNSPEVLQDLAKHLGDRNWCRKDGARLTRDEEWNLDWENFSNQLKHHTRYVFYRVDPAPGNVFEPARSPHEILETIGKLVVEQDLLRTVETGTRIVRARAHAADEAFLPVEELGPPPIDKARYSNRMSPAGIPMFYGAEREDTALNEVDGDDCATVADFVTLQPFKVLDLTRIPSIPSLFDQHRNHLRPALKFLTSFKEDLSKVVEKDGREHIEYIPTQVATEYFRRVFRDADNEPVRGIVYESSRHEGGISWVLFFENDDCTQDDRFDTSGKWLSMLTASVRRIDLKNRPEPPPVGRLF